MTRREVVRAGGASASRSSSRIASGRPRRSRSRLERRAELGERLGDPAVAVERARRGGVEPGVLRVGRERSSRNATTAAASPTAAARPGEDRRARIGVERAPRRRRARGGVPAARLGLREREERVRARRVDAHPAPPAREPRGARRIRGGPRARAARRCASIGSGRAARDGGAGPRPRPRDRPARSGRRGAPPPRPRRSAASCRRAPPPRGASRSAGSPRRARARPRRAAPGSSGARRGACSGGGGWPGRGRPRAGTARRARGRSRPPPGVPSRAASESASMAASGIAGDDRADALQVRLRLVAPTAQAIREQDRDDGERRGGEATQPAGHAAREPRRQPPPGLVERLHDDARVREHRHEVVVPDPARDDVPVEVVGDARPRRRARGSCRRSSLGASRPSPHDATARRSSSCRSAKRLRRERAEIGARARAGSPSGARSCTGYLLRQVKACADAVDDEVLPVVRLGRRRRRSRAEDAPVGFSARMNSIRHGAQSGCSITSS